MWGQKFTSGYGPVSARWARANWGEPELVKRTDDYAQSECDKPCKIHINHRQQPEALFETDVSKSHFTADVK